MKKYTPGSSRHPFLFGAQDGDVFQMRNLRSHCFRLNLSGRVAVDATHAVSLRVCIQKFQLPLVSIHCIRGGE